MGLGKPVSFINVPRIAQKPEFGAWLESLLQTPRNRRMLLQSGRNAVFKCFMEQATDQFRHDHDKLKKAHQAAGSSVSKKYYDTLKSRAKAMAGSNKEMVSEAVAALSIPRIGLYHRSTADYDGSDEQTYEDFVLQMQRANADVPLTKDTVDEAFRQAASQLKDENLLDSKKVKHMVDRCLEESKRYWKRMKKENEDSKQA
ncbi:hypothetical protein Q7P37_008163 [Cladosporium fusiforme]